MKKIKGTDQLPFQNILNTYKIIRLEFSSPEIFPSQTVLFVGEANAFFCV